MVTMPEGSLIHSQKHHRDRSEDRLGNHFIRDNSTACHPTIVQEFDR